MTKSQPPLGMPSPTEVEGKEVTTIYIFAEQTTTDGKRYLLGYEFDNPSTGDVEVLDVSEYLGKWRLR